jgi:heme exporter protein A
LSEKTLWILDEPVANLDTSGTQFLLAEMQAHLDQGGMLITTSNLNDQTLKPNSEINLDKA